MKNTTNRKRTLTNLIWRFLERCGAQGVGLIVSIVLARILTPDEYGVIALVLVFTSILQVFVDSGLGNALIQKKDADNVDFSTVFFFNVFACCVLYLAIFFAAPFISEFYEKPILTPLIRTMSLTLVLSGLSNVQQAYISKNFLFKKFFFSTIIGTVLSAVVSIYMAYKGYGVWALVAQTLVHHGINTLILWFTVKWRPNVVFSFVRLKGLFSYGWKLLASALIDRVYLEIRKMIIGKKYTSDDLGHYDNGQKIPNFLITNINTSIDSVLLPTLSDSQKDVGAVKNMTRRAIKTSSFVLWPMMVVLGVSAEPLVRVLLTEKWLASVPYLQIFCFTYAFFPIHTANLNAIKAMGRSDIFLKLEIIKKVIGFISVAISMWYGVYWMAASLLLTTVISSFINAFPNRKLLHYSYAEQIKDVLPSIALSVLMGVVVYGVGLLGLPDIVTLILQVALAVVVYVEGAIVYKIESFSYIVLMLKGLLLGENKEEKEHNEQNEISAENEMKEESEKGEGEHD